MKRLKLFFLALGLVTISVFWFPSLVKAQTTIVWDANSLEVKIEDDKFEVRGTFTLNDHSDGIAIPDEAVVFQLIGGSVTFSTTIPAGSFEKGEEGEFKFEGFSVFFIGVDLIGFAFLEVEITSLGGISDAGFLNSFEFKFEAEGVNLTGIANPVLVDLAIGDDGCCGSTVVAEIEGEGN